MVEIAPLGRNDYKMLLDLTGYDTHSIRERCRSMAAPQLIRGFPTLEKKLIL